MSNLLIKAKQKISETKDQHLNFTISKETWLALAGSVFDRELKSVKQENKASGGMVSAFLCAYGATPSKQDKAGINPFPPEGAAFDDDAVDNWMLTTDERPRTAVNLLPARQDKWDEKAALMLKEGMSKEFILTILGKRPE